MQAAAAKGGYNGNGDSVAERLASTGGCAYSISSFFSPVTILYGVRALHTDLVRRKSHRFRRSGRRVGLGLDTEDRKAIGETPRPLQSALEHPFLGRERGSPSFQTLLH